MLTLDSVYMSPNVAVAPAAAASSVDAPGWDRCRKKAWAEWLRPEVSADIKPETPPHRWVALQYGNALWEQFDPYGNNGDTIGGYYASDALPSPILEIGNPPVFGRNVGYWHSLDRQRSSTSTSNNMTALISRIDEYLSHDTINADRAQTVIGDISTALGHLKMICGDPVVEVDEDSSTVLLWEQGENTFALTFNGNGQVIGTLSPRQVDYQPWALPVDSATEIIDRISAAQVNHLLT